MDHKISSVLRVDRRYQRSVHLERDFTDASALSGYVPTPEIEGMLGRITSGIEKHPNRRAFRLTGNYGTGKSSFALLLAHVFHRGFQGLPRSLRKRFHAESVRGLPGFLPVLVTGSRDAINVAILRSLARALETWVDARAQLQVMAKLQPLIRGKAERVTDEIALELIAETTRELITKQRAAGLVIILDELGKFLEFAALRPERADIFFLQRLAELSCRSSLKPIFLVGLLHQNFGAYAHNLSVMDQREWEKVAGRFEDIALSQPPDQVVQLVGAALNVDSRDWPKHWEGRACESMRRLAEGGWFGAGAPIKSLVNAAPNLYPVHPSVVPALVRFFSRFGQNERSLFSFLLSAETGGLQEFAQNTLSSVENCYRLHHFYDYVAANYGDKLSVLSLQNHWNHINAVVRSIGNEWPAKANIAKTIGILNLLQSEQMSPTERMLLVALADLPKDQDVIRNIIWDLNKKEGVLYLRGKAGGYCLWSHTSVNLHEKYQEADRSLPNSLRVSSAIQGRLDNRPLVARRHYIETGNLRSFEVAYCSPNELRVRAIEPLLENDCRILIPLCENGQEQREALDFAAEFDRPEVITGIPQQLSGLDGYVREVERWEWISNNTPELKDDILATQEVSQKLENAKDLLERRVQNFVGLRHSDSSSPLRWYRNGEEHVLTSGHQFLMWLSEICDELYPLAPKIHNELINKRVLSSAAARARMKLVELMFTSAEQPRLGITKWPPEMSMYLSVLEHAKLHRLHGDKWMIDFPDSANGGKNDPANMLPALTAIRKKLESAPDSRVLVSELFDLLRLPPYGVREGLMPLLLTVVLLKHYRDIALYENGTFLSEIAAEEILRLSKVPSIFALQWCHVGGLRLTVFERLLGILGSKSNIPKDAELLDVVKPLVNLIAGLPPYARNTKALSPASISVREVLLHAGDPTIMLFRDLPNACNVEPLSPTENDDRKKAEVFVETLRSALNELRAAFPELLARVSSRVRQVFHLDKSVETLPKIRENVAARAGTLAPLVTDIELKGFCLRLADSVLDDGAWLESLGSFVAASPPSRWRNQDEYAFTERLHFLAAKFMRTEAAAFSSLPKNFNGTRVLVTITHSDGAEKSQVVHVLEGEMLLTAQLKKELCAKLLNNTVVDILAMSQLTWDLLDKNEKK